MNDKPVKPIIPICDCDSSQIARHGFCPINQILVFQFKRAGETKGERVPGTIYRYSGVPAALYSAYLASDSKGQFFAAHIKDAKNDDGTLKYPFEKQTDADAEFHPILNDDEQAAA